MSKFHDLIDGYYKFRGTEWLEERDRWKELAEGQSPRVMVIACSDSRVEPATIFGSRPGEIFVVRNVANLVPPFETGGGLHGVSAALEFAVTQLEVPEVLVMGHASCGGCKAALTHGFEDAKAGEGKKALALALLSCLMVICFSGVVFLNSAYGDAASMTEANTEAPASTAKTVDDEGAEVEAEPFATATEDREFVDLWQLILLCGGSVFLLLLIWQACVYEGNRWEAYF